jgi:hypothetical protein
MPPLLPPAADPRLAAPPAAPRPPGSEAAAARAARDFEGLGKGGAFGGGTAEEMWRPMLVNEFARVIAAGGGLGIADAVMRQMLAMQEQRA